MTLIKIGDYTIDEKSPAFIIAEAGVNHNGDIDLAKRLVDIAIESGVNAVKFQSFCTEELVTLNMFKAKYQKTNNKEQTQYQMLKNLELNFNEQKELAKYCKTKGIIFLSTPFDMKSFYFLDSINIEAYKVSSSDTNNYLFLKTLAKTGKPIILSTGMSYLTDVEKAINIIRKEKNNKVIVLHCTSSYPTYPEDCNLNAIKTIRNAFKTIVGFSDHTEGIGAAPYAIPLGAKVIEKHFTLDKSMEGPDHRASITPTELKALVKAIRYVEKLMGDGIKKPRHCENDTKIALQKKLVTSRFIQKGDVLCEEDLIAKRSRDGISVESCDLLIGKRVINNLEKDQVLSFKDIDM